MRFEVSLKGETYFVEVEKCAPASSTEFAAFGGNQMQELPKDVTVTEVVTTATGANTVNAPLPGAIVGIKVTVGQSVKKGQLVALLEAMKMENEIVAPTDGTVKAIIATKGTNVAVGDPIIELG